jgi:hypothetical protein
LILLAVRQKDSAFDVKNFVVFLSAGFVAILFSHPSVFVLAAIGTTMMVSALLKKQTREFWFYFFLSGICLLFFVALYYFIYRHLESNPFLMKFWGEAFMPFPPKNRGDLKWFFITYQQIFKNPMGYTLGGVAGLLFIAGAIRFWKTDRQ